ncbi:hypothetical protein LTR85_003313 [Meristemomyces frigidus]|nr:hypothetical protein LTR85_003313 [Meristemomyces frigidus]
MVRDVGLHGGLGAHHEDHLYAAGCQSHGRIHPAFERTEATCSNDTDDWGVPATIDSSQTLEGTPMHTPAATSVATAQFDLELPTAPESGMDDGTNIDDSFDENSFSMDNREVAADSKYGEYGSNLNVTSPGDLPKSHPYTPPHLSFVCRGPSQAQMKSFELQHTPASMSPNPTAGMAKISSRNASNALQLDGADKANAWHDKIACDRCGHALREKYYSCHFCGADGSSYKLCIDCNADHACSTMLTRITRDWRLDCSHTDRPCESFEQCFDRRCAAPDNGPIMRSHLESEFDCLDGPQENDNATRVTLEGWDSLSEVACEGDERDNGYVHGGEEEARYSNDRGGSSERTGSSIADGWGAPPPKENGEHGAVSYEHTGGWGGGRGVDGESAHSGANVSAGGGGSEAPSAQESDARIDDASPRCGTWGASSMQQGNSSGDATSPQVGESGKSVPQQHGRCGDAASPQAGGCGQPCQQQRHGGSEDAPSSFGSASQWQTPGPRRSSELSAAYKYLNIDPNREDRMTNERILQLFKAQEPDLGLAAAEKARLALGKIGMARDSWVLVDASKGSGDAHGAAMSSTAAKAWDSPSPFQAAHGGPRLGKSRVGQRQHLIAQAKALLSGDGLEFLLDGMEDAATLSRPPTGKDAPGVVNASLTSERDFLRYCLMADNLSEDERNTAIEIVSRLPEATLAPQHVEAYGIEAARSDYSREAATLEQLITGLSAKTISVEERLGSLTSYVQIEGKSRASMSDLYDKEFFRVGQDMTATVKRIEGLRGDVPAQAANLRSELQALSAAVAESVASVKLQIESVERKLESYASSHDAGKASLSMVTTSHDSQLALLFSRVNTHEDIISSMKQTSSAEVETLRCAAKTQKQSRMDLEQNIQAPGAASMEMLNARMAEHGKQYSAIEQRLKSLEQPAGPSVKDLIQELRDTTTSFDNEIESGNDRIARLEKDVGEGLNDRHLTDLEIQLAGLSEQYDKLNTTLSNGRGGLKVTEAIQEMRRQMDDLRQRRMDVDLSEVNARLDMGSDTDADILERLDRIGARLRKVETGAAAGPSPARWKDHVQCYNCQEYGHLARECIEPTECRVQCGNCDEVGHRHRECPLPTDWSRVTCSNCKEKGHSYKRCTNPAADSEADFWSSG